MKFNDDISTSGPVAPQDVNFSNQFTDYKELPSNGYSRLFRAQRYGQWYMLKGLKPEYADDPQYSAMLSKEFSLTVELNHPSIVRALSYEQDAVAGDCIVMEYVDGCTLDEFLRMNPSETTRRQIVQELLEAMAYYHRKQVVHQDLKPSNILITHDGNHVRIIDFGFADSRSFTILKEPAYTQSYAAPEQLGDGEIDNRTDIYAFGLILKQLFPTHYRSVVRKCLQPQKQNRYASVESVLKALDAADHAKLWKPVVVVGVSLVAIALALLFTFPSRINKRPDPAYLPTIDNASDAGLLKGVFSVSSHKKVRFSQGNLQYSNKGEHATADGTIVPGTWRFAENQYDIIGKNNTNASATYTGWIDLFGWGTSGWNSGAVCYEPWSSSLGNNDYYPGGHFENNLTGSFAFADWGVYNAISNGGNRPEMWRVLTDAEWGFLLESREASTINGVSNARYALATVNGVGGLMLFPDKYSHPKSLPDLLEINTDSIDYTSNTYSTEQWSLMESAGVVFLPAACLRYGLRMVDANTGHYYSSTSYSSSQVYGTHFVCHPPSQPVPSAVIAHFEGWRLYGCSVRLVREVD